MIISETVIRNIVKNVLKRVLSENVDEETYSAFHGSPSARIEQGKFKRGKYGYLGGGIYFSTSEYYAKHYAGKYDGHGTIYTVAIDINNPLILSSVNPTEEFLTKIYGSKRIYQNRSAKQSFDTRLITNKDIQKLFSLGYDGVIWEYAGEKEFCVYDNSQIKILDKKEV